MYKYFRKRTYSKIKNNNTEKKPTTTPLESNEGGGRRSSSAATGETSHRIACQYVYVMWNWMWCPKNEGKTKIIIIECCACVMSMITTMININDKNSQFIFIFSKALHTYRSCSLVVYIHILYMLCVCKHQERGLLSMASAYTFTKKNCTYCMLYGEWAKSECKICANEATNTHRSSTKRHRRRRRRRRPNQITHISVVHNVSNRISHFPFVNLLMLLRYSSSPPFYLPSFLFGGIFFLLE